MWLERERRLSAARSSAAAVSFGALDTAWLQRLVDAATPEGLDDFTVTFLRGDDHRGAADGLTRTARIWVGGAVLAGCVAIAAGTSKIGLRSLAEVAVFLTAHELRHLGSTIAGARPTHRDPGAVRPRARR